MFTVFANDDVSVISLNECLLAASCKSDGVEYARISTGFSHDNNNDNESGCDTSPRVVVRLRYDHECKHHIENSDVRNCYLCESNDLTF